MYDLSLLRGDTEPSLAGTPSPARGEGGYGRGLSGARKQAILKNAERWLDSNRSAHEPADRIRAAYDAMSARLGRDFTDNFSFDDFQSGMQDRIATSAERLLGRTERGTSELLRELMASQPPAQLQPIQQAPPPIGYAGSAPLTGPPLSHSNLPPIQGGGPQIPGSGMWQPGVSYGEQSAHYNAAGAPGTTQWYADPPMPASGFFGPAGQFKPKGMTVQRGSGSSSPPAILSKVADPSTRSMLRDQSKVFEEQMQQQHLQQVAFRDALSEIEKFARSAMQAIP
jgi:hypothetical protein